MRGSPSNDTRFDPRLQLATLAPAHVLACLLLDGETMPVDEARAVQLLQAAAGSGDAQSRDLLTGNGLPFD